MASARSVTTEEVVAGLERSLLDREVRASASALDLLLADDFVEFPSIGRAFGKSEAIARIPNERDRSFSVSDLRVQVLAPTVALVTYTAAISDGSSTMCSNRSSVWVLERDQWRMVFHQGTGLADGV